MNRNNPCPKKNLVPLIGKLFCDAHVYFTAEIFPFYPPNIRIRHDSKFAEASSLYLYKGLANLINGCYVYYGCAKVEKLKSNERMTIQDHYLFVKQNAILLFTKANRHLILYDISRKIIEKKGDKTDDVLERIEKIGERVFRQFSEVGYTTHILAFPARISDEFSSTLKAYNLYLLSQAIALTSEKRYFGINLARCLAMIMLKRSLVITHEIVKNSPVASTI